MQFINSRWELRGALEKFRTEILFSGKASGRPYYFGLFGAGGLTFFLSDLIEPVAKRFWQTLFDFGRDQAD